MDRSPQDQIEQAEKAALAVLAESYFELDGGRIDFAFTPAQAQIVQRAGDLAGVTIDEWVQSKIKTFIRRAGGALNAEQN